MKTSCRFSVAFVCWATGLGLNVASADVVTVATFPITFTSSGRIEIWAKLEGYSANAPIKEGSFGGGGFPWLFTGSQGFAMVFTRNDGAGGGGLSGIGQGNSTTAFSAATGSFVNTFTYGNILGAGVNNWNKYDLVWNFAGLPDGNTVDVYVDGVLNSSFHRNDYGGFSPGSGTLYIGFPPGQGNDPGKNIAFDELKIWNTTDSTALPVLYNSFENTNLISSIGPNGTYVSGAFVQGVVGNAISTVPEPSTWALMILGLAGLGFAGYRRTKKGTVARAAV